MPSRRDDAPDLFGTPEPPPEPGPAGPRPLADRLRPRTLAEVIGQEHLLGPAGTLSGMLARGTLPSLILWGPPGVGKTTIARLLAEAAGLAFQPLSAVFSGVADLKRAFDEARARRRAAGARDRGAAGARDHGAAGARDHGAAGARDHGAAGARDHGAAGARDHGGGRGTLLFVDEIHRFNRAQQDGFLPVVEDGTVTLVGATTENPSFALNGALLSRCQVLVLRRLDDAALEALLARAEAAEDRPLPLTPEARASLRAMADGDGRYLLNMAEQLLAIPPGGAALDPAALAALLAKRAALYDKDREEHFNLISALHKSLRGSDPDAALYWLARMLTGGEDPRYVARRLTRFAAEDVGMADPRALPLAVAAWETYERLGSPEGELALAQLVVHLATAPKSNAVYVAFGEAMRAAKETGSLMPPAHILNAPTKLMKELGYGAGYAYDHDEAEGFSGADYWPEGMDRRRFYRPTERGAEAAVAQRLKEWEALRARKARRR